MPLSPRCGPVSAGFPGRGAAVRDGGDLAAFDCKEANMPKVKVQKIVNAPVAEVWASWDSFGDIADFNPSLRASRLINGSAPSGKGATRQCDLKDGKNHIRERIVEYDPGRRMVIDIYEGTMPLKRTLATVEVRAMGPARTEVSMTMDFAPKFGLLGLAMVPVMKPTFRRMLRGLLDGNAVHVEGMRGTVAA